MFQRIKIKYQNYPKLKQTKYNYKYRIFVKNYIKKFNGKKKLNKKIYIN